MEGIAFPANVRAIGTEAFCGNPLEGVAFSTGSTLGTVGDYAFGGSQLDCESVCFPRTRVCPRKRSISCSSEQSDFSISGRGRKGCVQGQVFSAYVWDYGSASFATRSGSYC